MEYKKNGPSREGFIIKVFEEERVRQLEQLELFKDSGFMERAIKHKNKPCKKNMTPYEKYKSYIRNTSHKFKRL